MISHSIRRKTSARGDLTPAEREKVDALLRLWVIAARELRQSTQEDHSGDYRYLPPRCLRRSLLNDDPKQQTIMEPYNAEGLCFDKRQAVRENGTPVK
jgi:hypothetical protein